MGKFMAEKNKKEKRECEHELIGESCPSCGYIEGECEKCGKYVCGDYRGNRTVAAIRRHKE
ncbi:hypothetical protein ACFL6S_14255 [Candidatus Poribacteria bacterium]